MQRFSFHRSSLSIMLGLTALLLSMGARQAFAAAPADRPNVLWVVSEDNFPYLGCYGDPVARTPTLDKLASEGVLFENCFSAAPVCAPSRFTLITGMYAPTAGPGQHMRAQGKLPNFATRGFPAYLREAGYYCTNNAKTDYNSPIDMKGTWDQSSKQATYRNRPAGKPFFAVFNHETTHESSIFGKKQSPLPGGMDPAKVRIPAYYPDTPETRRDKALYYDNLHRMDQQVARLLKQLEDDGLADNTIVFYYGDNGGVLPRSKRFCYDSGLHVPLIVRFPAKWQHLAPARPGSRIMAPVTFVDFAPTVMSLAGIDAPKHFQGQAFLGAKKSPDRQYALGFRNRMDERYDFVRTLRDARYRYIRNYNPHVPTGQHVQYLWQQAGMRVWEQLYKEGKLNDVQKRYWLEKPEEELYDLQADPDEVKNLVDSPEHQPILQRMRQALREQLLAIRDNGFIPEGAAAEGYDAARDEKLYPMERVMAAADVATRRDPANLPKLIEFMQDPNDVIQYWGALGCVMLKDKAAPAKEQLSKSLGSASPQVQVACAESLCWIGELDKGLAALQGLLKCEISKVRLQAANALDHLGQKAKPALASLQAAKKDSDNYVVRAASYTAAVLAGEVPPLEQP